MARDTVSKTSNALPPTLGVEIRRHSPAEPWTYALLDERQREIQDGILNRGERGKILLSEVAPVVTLGHRSFGSSMGLRLAPAQIRAQGVDFYLTGRGGNATYHGTGQWVLFVVERLDRLVGDPRGVKETFRRLETLTLRVAREWCARAEVRSGAEAGIWSGSGSRAKKLASFGIKIDHGVLLHGICLNGFATRESFFGIDPCGLRASPGFLMAGPEESEFFRMGVRLVQETYLQFNRSAAEPIPR